MRFVFFLFALLCAGGIFWLSAMTDAEADKQAWEAKLRAQLAENGIRLMLWNSDEYAFSNIVIGAAEPSGRVTFRGMLMEDGGMRLVYGHVSPICEEDLDDPSCWTIAHLEVDGRDATLASRMPGE